LQDDAYYERRKKNNDAAKRSRDARRMKEEQTANRAVTLEHENAKLRTEISSLKSEITKLRVLILANPTSGIVKPQPISIAHNEASSSSD
jgi:bZIP factor